MISRNNKNSLRHRLEALIFEILRHLYPNMDIDELNYYKKRIRKDIMCYYASYIPLLFRSREYDHPLWFFEKFSAIDIKRIITRIVEGDEFFSKISTQRILC